MGVVRKEAKAHKRLRLLFLCGVRGVRVSEARVGGWRKTALARAGDRGAHHMGACVPPSTLENRAPLLLMKVSSE
ncbi:MAG: hypothetical protein LBL06_04755 [Treponema sp.]|nr:hypothetical protein [Treponema sp.]